MVSDTETTDEHKSRNTKGTKARSWFGTWNSYPVDWKSHFEVFERCTAQLEKGETQETQHIQWVGRYRNARSFEQVKKHFPGAHIEVVKNWPAAQNYCKKEKTYMGERFIKPKPRTIKDPLEGKTYNDLQKKILEILGPEPDDRTVNWIYDPDGCKGKTTMAKHLCLKQKNVLYVSGKSADIKYGVMEWIDKRELRTVFVNLSRSTENFVSYQGIEEVKDGIFYSTKFKSGMCIFDCPHVIILANFLPDMKGLSADRWNIIKMEEPKKTKTQYDIMLDEVIEETP